MANLITMCRIILSVILLFPPVFSVPFCVIYVLAGVTDIMDGAIARKMNTASDFGSKLDTAADLVFVIVCFVKILPSVTLPVFLYIWMGIVSIIKLASAAHCFMAHREFPSAHTMLNKVTGFLLFLLPLTLPYADIRISGSTVCTAATFAAIHEYLILSK